jgi:hypothetical protein
MQSTCRAEMGAPSSLPPAWCCCRYFANLANVAGAVDDIAAPSRDQLKLVLKRADGASALTQQQVEGLCSQAAISAPVVARVLEAGRFSGGAGVIVDKFLFLLLAMTCDSFAAVIEAIFEVFGSELDAKRFVDLISYLAPDMDPDVTTQFLADLNSTLMDVELITYRQAMALDVLSEKLKA